MTNNEPRTIRTQDGVDLHEGDRAFNYYDQKPGMIRKIDSHAQPDPEKGESSSTPIAEWTNYWFDFLHDDGTTSSLDGSRICSENYARRRWPN